MTLSNSKTPIYFLGWILIIVYATWSHLYFGNYDANVALGGWSAHDFANSILFPENFTLDYPGGSWTSGNSSLPWVYPALASIGIPVDITIPIFIALEILVLTAGAFYLLQTLFKNIHYVALIALTSLFTLSYIRFGDLARFANPFFHGQFYGYADGLRLFAIAFYLRGRYTLSAGTLIIGFTVHPIKTLFGFIFICGMQLWKWRTSFQMNIVLPYLLFTFFAGLWAYLWLGLGRDLDFPQMTSEEFFKYSPLFNSHWYPQDLNILTDHHLVYSTAFLSSLLVGLSTIIRCDFKTDFKIQLFIGILLVSTITAIGLIVSWYELSPFLVKVSLQRSTVLILSITTVLTLGKWLFDLKDGHWWYASLLAVLLYSSFFTNETWPALFSIAYALSTLFSAKQDDSAVRALKATVFVLCIFIAGYECYLYYQGFQKHSYWLIQAGALAVIAIVLATCKKLDQKYINHIDKYLQKYSLTIATLIFIASAITWSIDTRTLSDAYIEKGRAYKDAQLWAKENTKHNALFMTDPTISYGWRDYSQRSSFGTLQEWFKTGWLYSGNQQSLHMGLERADSLGVSELVPERAEKRPRSEFISKSYRHALDTFYKPGGEILASIAQIYDINYMVMDNNNAKKYGAMPQWSVAFENNYYTVLIPPHIKPTK